MNKIHLVVHDGSWRLENSKGTGMDNVGIFLASDVTWDGAPYFRQWLEKNYFYFMEGNFSLLIKDRATKKDLKINCKYASDFEKTAFNLPLDAMIDLLQQWETMCQKYESKLTGVDITFDGTKFYLEPHVHNS